VNYRSLWLMVTEQRLKGEMNHPITILNAPSADVWVLRLRSGADTGAGPFDSESGIVISIVRAGGGVEAMQ
jgi:hypothetical protein